MRLLVVEDAPRMAGLLRRGLSEEGYAVDVVGTGSEAVWLVGEVAYDAVVLDLGLPDIDGLEVCRRLRAGGCDAAVLILTARGEIGDRVRGLDLGADDYLLKPFAIQELFARLRCLVRRTPSQRPPTLRVADLELDPAAHTVRRAGARIVLTPKEFALLEYLMRYHGEAISRARLIEHVWDFAFEKDSNVVDVYVGYLREKVDRPFGGRLIETVRGVGYRVGGDEPDGAVA